MSMRTSPCVEYAFETRITALATATTLASATRHEFAAITVNVPETASRKFLSAHLEFDTRDAFTAAADIDGVRMGVRFAGETACGSNLYKSSGVDGTYANASSQTFAADGYVEIVYTGEVARQTLFALTDVDSSTAGARESIYTTAKYGIYFGSGVAVVRESNSTKFSSAADFTRLGDIFRIERVGTVVTYSRNGVVFYTSLVSSSGALLVDVEVRFLGTYYGLLNVRLYSAGVEQTIVWTNIIEMATDAQTYNDRDVFTAAANTADHAWDRWTYDITPLMNRYFATGTSKSIQPSFAMASGSAQNVGMVTCKLVLVYEYNDTSETALLKTVRFPFGYNGNLTDATVIELGTNSYPQLTGAGGILPESSIVLRQVFLDLWSNDNSTTTADVTPYVQIDATAEVARANQKHALITNTPWHDLLVINTATHLPSAAHAIKMRLSGTGQFNTPCGFVVVTYEYAKASTRVLAEAIVPLVVTDSKDTTLTELGILAATEADAEWYGCDLNVQEPGTITLVQSGVFVMGEGWSSSTSFRLALGTQAFVNYSIASAGGQQPIIRRGDIDSGAWTLAAGRNRLVSKAATSGSPMRASHRGHAIVNYTCDAPLGGPAIVNLPRCQMLAPYSGLGITQSTNREIAPDADKSPVLHGAYEIQGAFAELQVRNATAAVASMIVAKLAAGEHDGGGWVAANANPQGPAERMTRVVMLATTRWWNRTSLQTGRADMEAQRRVRMFAINSEIAGLYWWTHHGCTFTVAGTWTGYTGDGSGITVKIWNAATGELVATVTTTAGGAFTATVLNGTDLHFAEAYQDATHRGRSVNAYPVAVAA